MTEIVCMCGKKFVNLKSLKDHIKRKHKDAHYEIMVKEVLRK